MEINSEEPDKVKELKELRIVSEPLGQYQIHQHSNYRGPRRRREKRKGMRKFLQKL